MPGTLPLASIADILDGVKKLFVDITVPDSGGSRLGRYEVVEHRKDGSLLLAPESVETVISETSDRPLSGGEFLDALARLDTAASQHRD